MKREFLKELGLEDEAIDKIMAEHGKTVNETKQKAEKVDSLEEQLEDYKKQISERDTQLEELKKVDAEGLQAKIDELQQQNETTKTEYEEKLQQQAFDHKLESALSGAKVKNTRAVKALLDMDTIKLDGDTLKGLDDQLNNLKESDAYLFESEESDPKPTFTTGQHNKGGNMSAKDLMKMTYKERVKFKKENPEKYKQLSGN